MNDFIIIMVLFSGKLTICKSEKYLNNWVWFEVEKLILKVLTHFDSYY